MGLGENIRRNRERMGLDQGQLAKMVDRTNGAVSQWESNSVVPRMPTIHKLADLFGVPVSELLGERQVVGTSAFVPMRTLGSVHMGEMGDEPNPDRMVEVPRHVLEEVNDPDAYVVRMHGACMNRRYPEDCDALISPRSEPTDGAGVIAEYNGETICRTYRRGASTVMLSPDSFDPSYRDIVFTDPDSQTVELQGVVRWFQASRVEG